MPISSGESPLDRHKAATCGANPGGFCPPGEVQLRPESGPGTGTLAPSQFAPRVPAGNEGKHQKAI
jgi:hypothetical protein